MRPPYGSRDVRSIIGSKIANQLGNLFRFAYAAKRNFMLESELLFWIRECGFVDGRIDRARRYVDYVDAIGRKFYG